VALGVRDVVPWWAVAVLVARDLVLGACLPVLRARGFSPFRVTYLGKSATFLLLYAFPLLLLGVGTSALAPIARPFGYAFAVWGTALYLWSGLLYLAQFALALRSGAEPQVTPPRFTEDPPPGDVGAPTATEEMREGRR
jgi:cardiolipin synthase